MRIYLHIGLPAMGSPQLQNALAEKRERLAQLGYLFPRALGAKNHTRLFMAVSAPERPEMLRLARGHGAAPAQAALARELGLALARDIAATQPQALIVSCHQLGGGLAQRDELQRLYGFLSQFSTDIRVIAHIDAQAPAMARYFAAQVFEGRATPLQRDLGLLQAGGWGQAALGVAPTPEQAQQGQFLETEAPAFWLDYAALQAHWQAVFGAENVIFRPYDAAVFDSADAPEELRAMFEIDASLGRCQPSAAPAQPSAAWVARARQMNHLLQALLGQGTHVLPRTLWRRILANIAIEGPAIDPRMLAGVAAQFDEGNKAVLASHPALSKQRLCPDLACLPWHEADPGQGYRASQHLLAQFWQIERATREARAGDPPAQPPGQSLPAQAKGRTAPQPSATAQRLLSPLALQNFEKLHGTPFYPHNAIGPDAEDRPAPPFAPAPARSLPPGCSGNVIVACMKNEAPYILEWVAYHRAIGIDTFLIYTNDCTDGTDQLLQRLDALGIVHHRNNDAWKGNSPQQYALNRALKEPVITQADWVIHIDVDEFINIRCGNGTLQDFLALVPDATNVAMTWRMFGHNGVRQLADQFVIGQFDHAAPKYCPKPHTVWGFKTMVRNIGAYAKLSCHRPNKLNPDYAAQVKWVNGAGQDMTRETRDKGWRNSVKSIGYDLLQLNHYALRSAESYLIKRQRGRALHVDRSIGLNYWIRMDWCDHKDISIQRNLPRLEQAYQALMQDDQLRALHDAGFAWHREKAAELHATPEFATLYAQALEIKLTAAERVAYALALDLES